MKSGLSSSGSVIYYPPDMTRSNSILLCKRWLANSTSGVSVSYFINNFIGYLGQLMSILKSALSSHVSHVFELCSKKQMARSNASWVIAMVKHHHSIGYLPLVHNPACPVRTSSSKMGSAIGHLTVPVSIHGADPVPAITIPVRDLNVLPKPSGELPVYSLRIESESAKHVLHINHWLMCHAPGIARCAGAFSELYQNKLGCQL